MKKKLWNRSFVIASITNFLMGSAFNLLIPTILLYLSEYLNVPQAQIGIVLSSYVLVLYWKQVREFFFRGYPPFISTWHHIPKGKRPIPPIWWGLIWESECLPEAILCTVTLVFYILNSKRVY